MIILPAMILILPATNSFSTLLFSILETQKNNKIAHDATSNALFESVSIKKKAFINQIPT